MEQDDVLDILRDLKSELAQYKVREIALFGSFVRNEQKHASDIDVLLDKEEMPQIRPHIENLLTRLSDRTDEQK